MKGSPHPYAKQWEILNPGTFPSHLDEIEQPWALELTNLVLKPDSLAYKQILP